MSLESCHILSLNLNRYYLLEFADRTFQLIWPCKSNEIRFIENCCSSQPVYATLVNPPPPPHTHTHTQSLSYHSAQCNTLPYPCTIQFGDGSKAWEYFYMRDINVYLERQRGKGCPNWNNDLEAFSCWVDSSTGVLNNCEVAAHCSAKRCIPKMLLNAPPSFV